MGEVLLSALPFAIIAAAFFGIYLFKVSKAKQFLSEAQDAEVRGDYATAVELFRKALWKANEKPEMERAILASLAGIYAKHDIGFDTADYEKLIEQFEVLKKKSSRRALREMGQVNKLKKALIDRMPELR